MGVSRVGGRTVCAPVCECSCGTHASTRAKWWGFQVRDGTPRSVPTLFLRCPPGLAGCLPGCKSQLPLHGGQKAGRGREAEISGLTEVPGPAALLFLMRDSGSAPGALGRLTETQHRPLALQTRDAHAFMSHSKLRKKTWTYSPSHWLGHAHSQSLDSLTHSG